MTGPQLTQITGIIGNMLGAAGGKQGRLAWYPEGQEAPLKDALPVPQYREAKEIAVNDELRH